MKECKAAVTQKKNYKGHIGIQSSLGKTLAWFVLANAAVVISLAIISGGALLEFLPFLLVLGSFFPLIALLFSKSIAKRAQKIEMINPDNFKSESEKGLYQLVETLSKRAGPENVSEVDVYKSNDLNAFVTGMNKKRSPVAFSSGLLANLDEQGVAAVATHELGHITNGDMLTLTLIQSVVNALVLLITIPLNVFKLLALFSDDVGAIEYMIISFVKFVVSSICLFLGNLVVKAFSRRREFQADRLAATLIDKDSMIHALESLKDTAIKAPKEQAAFAAFKINSSPAWLDIFSTHPSIERRIARLHQHE